MNREFSSSPWESMISPVTMYGSFSLPSPAHWNSSTAASMSASLLMRRVRGMGRMSNVSLLNASRSPLSLRAVMLIQYVPSSSSPGVPTNAEPFQVRNGALVAYAVTVASVSLNCGP